jgi:alkanesulfonate monooxygenase SsuD/methylene tetrahydromethanopterin reductase-like flavin-dependent oxidoreductase (luciferase family)
LASLKDVLQDPEAMRLGLGFNPVLPVVDVVNIAVKAETLGYHSIWLHESLFQRDTVSYLSSILRATTRLKAGSGVINTFTRHPVAAATTFATLSESSNGRVMMGLGLGSFPTIPKIGFQIFPVRETHPLRRVREYVQIVKALWTGENVSFHGDFFTTDNLQLGFKVTQSIPLYIAGLSRGMLEFAGRVGDGALLSPALSTVKSTQRMCESVKSGESSSNRRVDRASYLMTSADPDENKARDTMKGFYFFLYQLAEVLRTSDLEEYGVNESRLAPMKAAWKKGDLAGAKNAVPNEAVEALTMTGRKDDLLNRLEEYLGVGVDLPIVMPVGNIEYAVSALSPAGNASG